MVRNVHSEGETASDAVPSRSTSGMAATLLRTRYASGLWRPSPRSRLKFSPLGRLVTGGGGGCGGGGGGAAAAANPPISIEPGVRRAIEEGRPVVALESTIISHGMPYPDNLAMAR